jgi:hypothetical protein
MKQEQYIHIDQYGNKFVYMDKAMTVLHRTDGPAMEYADGTKFWWVDGQRHRSDGPAIESFNGHKFWYVDGKSLTEKEFNALTRPIELTLEDIAAKFGVDVNNLKIVK